LVLGNKSYNSISIGDIEKMSLSFFMVMKLDALFIGDST